MEQDEGTRQDANLVIIRLKLQSQQIVQKRNDWKLRKKQNFEFDEEECLSELSNSVASVSSSSLDGGKYLLICLDCMFSQLPKITLSCRLVVPII